MRQSRETVTQILGFFGKHRFLSNFYADMNPIVGANPTIYYPTAEHFYQAQKFVEIEAMIKIANAATPGEAKFMGGCNGLVKKGYQLVTDLNYTRDYLMWLAVRKKFCPQKNPQLVEKLVSTKGKRLVELNDWNDTYWGMTENQDGTLTGNNRLGEMLMDLRNLLG